MCHTLPLLEMTAAPTPARWPISLSISLYLSFPISARKKFNFEVRSPPPLVLVDEAIGKTSCQARRRKIFICSSDTAFVYLFSNRKETFLHGGLGSERKTAHRVTVLPGCIFCNHFGNLGFAGYMYWQRCLKQSHLSKLLR